MRVRDIKGADQSISLVLGPLYPLKVKFVKQQEWFGPIPELVPLDLKPIEKFQGHLRGPVPIHKPKSEQKW